ncbi:hypothetical protein TrLO_g3149 [Triparma laevis f. longispina]|uniref:Uncharacterized protein n=1 Tax=Triparma laevis f. longispina TaxID=1714387 RepID=A0A9W7F5R6_9STRA|nr:hypothetical protein TrLO_g3149 [Triparma laevis f. longispina]
MSSPPASAVPTNNDTTNSTNPNTTQPPSSSSHHLLLSSLSAYPDLPPSALPLISSLIQTRLIPSLTRSSGLINLQDLKCDHGELLEFIETFEGGTEDYKDLIFKPSGFRNMNEQVQETITWEGDESSEDEEDNDDIKEEEFIPNHLPRVKNVKL